MLEAQNRIHLGKDIHQWVEDAITVSGVKQTELTPQVLIDSTKLPGNFHKDPADRMIIATSRANGLLLLTQDERILAYSQEGYVNTVR